MDESPGTFAERLRLQRRAVGMTQEALAEAAGLSVRAVSDLERGLKHTPRRDTLRALADALGLLPTERASWEAVRRRLSLRPVRTRRAPTPGGLPVYLTSFVGRASDVREVVGLLSEARLLTLTGAGGCGKTRLAAHAAVAGAGAHAAGVWFVDLAPVGDPGLVPQSVLTALGLREAPGREPVAAVAAHLRGRAALLLLDNCEHLVEACAHLSEALLRSCPGLRVLATSREPLGVDGETIWRVPPLPVPPAGAPADPTRLRSYAAVRLFTERARTAQPAFALTAANAPAVAAVCRWLDGLPLALELAAARVPVLGVEGVSVRLGDAFHLLRRGARTALPRHQTLRAMVDWSHNLLSAPEQTLFARLSVFAGAFGVEAAESVAAGDGVGPDDVLDLLARLVEKSLVQAEDGGRFRLLETLRQYAAQRLRARGETDAVRARHAAHYLQLAERIWPQLRAGDAASALARLDAELDNIRAALRWFADAGEAADGLRLLRASREHWYKRGRTVEQLLWMERFLDLPGAAASPPAVLADVLADTTQQVVMQGRPARWVELADRGIAAARAAEDPMLLVSVLARVAMVHLWRGEGVALVRHLTEIEALCRAAGEPVIADLARADTAFAAFLAGDLDRARTLLGDRVAAARRAGLTQHLAMGLEWLGGVVLVGGDAAAAAPLLDESLALYRQVEDRFGEAHALLSLGFCAVVRGDAAGARRVLRECLELMRRIDDVVYLGFALEGLAGVALLDGRPRDALVLAGAAEASRAPGGGARWPMFVAPIDAWVAGARAALAGEAAAVAWAEGLGMSFDLAVDVALGERIDA
jgi:predicted ATPase/transcriptional regulator with XRE-family HTH domain